MAGSYQSNSTIKKKQYCRHTIKSRQAWPEEAWRPYFSKGIVSTWRIALHRYVYKSVVVLFVVTVLKKGGLKSQKILQETENVLHKFQTMLTYYNCFLFFGFWVQVILRGQDGIPNHIKGCPLSCMFLEAALQKKEHTRYTKARINSNKRKCPFSNSPECVSLHLKPLLRLTNTKA